MFIVCASLSVNFIIWTCNPNQLKQSTHYSSIHYIMAHGVFIIAYGAYIIAYGVYIIAHGVYIIANCIHILTHGVCIMTHNVHIDPGLAIMSKIFNNFILFKWFYVNL